MISISGTSEWWAVRGLNPRPSRCKRETAIQNIGFLSIGERMDRERIANKLAFAGHLLTTGFGDHA